MVSGSCQCPDGILEELFAGGCRRPVWVTLIGNLLSLGVVMVYTGVTPVIMHPRRSQAVAAASPRVSMCRGWWWLPCGLSGWLRV